MSKGREHRGERGRLAAIERQLRSLPAPPVPSDLEARIVAGIPVQLGRGRKVRVVWRIAAVAAMGAAAAVVAIVFRPVTKTASPLAVTTVPGVIDNTDPDFILHVAARQHGGQETNTCQLIPACAPGS